MGPMGLSVDSHRVEFSIIWKTSMLRPHVSSLPLTLRGPHHDWDTIMIHSTLMTAAHAVYPDDGGLLDVATSKAATPFN